MAVGLVSPTSISHASPNARLENILVPALHGARRANAAGTPNATAVAVTVRHVPQDSMRRMCTAAPRLASLVVLAAIRLQPPRRAPHAMRGATRLQKVGARVRRVPQESMRLPCTVVRRPVMCARRVAPASTRVPHAETPCPHQSRSHAPQKCHRLRLHRTPLLGTSTVCAKPSLLLDLSAVAAPLRSVLVCTCAGPCSGCQTGQCTSFAAARRIASAPGQ